MSHKDLDKLCKSAAAAERRLWVFQWPKESRAMSPEG